MAAPPAHATSPAAPEQQPPRVPINIEEALGLDAPPDPAASSPSAPLDPAFVSRLAYDVLEHFGQNHPDPASFPAVAAQILDVVEDPRTGTRELSRIIMNDPAITSRVLQVANSSYYRRSQEIETVGAAVTLLGAREVASLAAGVAGRSLYESETVHELQMFGPRFADLFHRAMTTAYAASYYAIARHVGRSDESFLGGMLHHIGKVIALRSLAALMADGRAPAEMPAHLVDAVLERVHVRISADATAAWRLPRYLLTICARQHEPDLPVEPALKILHLVRVTSGMVAVRRDGVQAAWLAPEIAWSARALDIPLAQIPAMMDRVAQFAAQVSAMFSVEENARLPARPANRSFRSLPAVPAVSPRVTGGNVPAARRRKDPP